MDDELLVRVPGGAPPAGPRADRTRAAIVRAATELFLAHGYQATGTDRIAAAAAVSKQTVYNQFGDKERLFAAVVLGVTATAEAFALEVAEILDGVARTAEVEPALRRLAHRWATAVLGPRVTALRRLVIAEATRFPDLAAQYHRRAPAATLRAVAGGLRGLAERGLLEVADPDRAAADFAFVLVGAELDHGMFHPGATPPDAATLDALVDHAVRVLLGLYPPAR